jgi:hypothetical protein
VVLQFLLSAQLFSDPPLPTALPNVLQPTVVRSDRKLLLDTAEEGAQKELAVKAASGPHNFKSFEEMLDASGMLADKPAIKAGASGKDGYIVQVIILMTLQEIYDAYMDW